MLCTSRYIRQQRDLQQRLYRRTCDVDKINKQHDME